jgi:regulator of sigma E protease
MNLVAAFVLLTIAAAVGIPKLIDNQFTVASDTKIVKQEVYVGYVEAGSPADKAGLKVRDKIIDVGHVDGGCATCFIESKHLTAASQLPQITQKYAGQEVLLGIERNGAPQIIHMTLRSHDEVEASKKTDEPKGYMGVSPTEYTVQRSTWSSPIVAAGLIKQFTIQTLKGIGSALSGLSQGNTAKASEQVSGPVGVFVLLKDGSLLGPEFVLFIIAVISLTLAIMNVLPIPALDGGRLFVTLIYKVRKKPLTKEAEDRIHGFGFIVLMILFVLITVVDVKRFF